MNVSRYPIVIAPFAGVGQVATRFRFAEIGLIAATGDRAVDLRHT